ncbi:MAG TPA: penicillin acylase family protein [Thermoanaerobaculia bacterium]|nr:penicillin acylase family protein [Thermoanaerobaculia bacterium]
MREIRRTLLATFLLPAALAVAAPPRWADQVTIHRDTWGVPHVDGETDAAVAFGSAWAQCEDHFFQLEDTYVQALGRYAELVGEDGVRSDLEVAAFELVATSQRDLPQLPEEIQRIATAFAAGYNFYLEKNPGVKPRLLERMEPWHVLAFERFMILPRLLGAAHAPRRELSELALEEAASLGSNQWAVGPSKTRDGSTMLFINPHQPWYGSGTFTEMHVRSGEGWNFSGAMYPGAPFPTAGFNERLGWAYTVNEADIADLYRLTFDHPSDPLLYRYGTGYRQARAWSTTLRVRVGERLEERAVTLRASHHGPVIAREDEVHFLAARVPKLYQGSRMVQALAQTKARTFEEWYRAASMLQLQTFNTLYADADGHIFYLYNGTVPKRDPAVDWTKPVDGSDPKLEWNGFHPIEELPQILDPRSGYLQNCNSTPFTTTDDDNPSLLDFPPYMVEDRHDDKRRAKVSRLLLREAGDLTFEDWQQLAYDTTLYWPLTEIPRYARHLETLATTHPELHARVLPYFRHLQDWDFRSSLESTQTTLAVEWYERLYGRGYPVETLKPEYVTDVPARFDALIAAAERLRQLYGDWRVPYGDIHRLQRHANQTERDRVPFDDRLPSLPLAGVRGPLGVAFTLYHTPPTDDPHRKLQYATTGASYMAVVEFRKHGPRAASYLHYGQSHDPASPHFFDQAKLLSDRRFKPAWLDWGEVVANTERAYRPGGELPPTSP